VAVLFGLLLMVSGCARDEVSDASRPPADSAARSAAVTDGASAAPRRASYPEGEGEGGQEMNAAVEVPARARVETRADVARSLEGAPSEAPPSQPETVNAPPRQEPVLVDGKWEIREISMGRVPAPSALEGKPGYYPPDDPEFDALLRGRREVGEIDAFLKDGMPSAESLARAILEAVEAGDARQLSRLRIDFEEFSRILWPEFPQSRPVTHAEAEDAWGFLHRECSEGISRGLQDWGGMKLDFQRLSFSIGLGRYTNFDLYQGVQIHVVTCAGAAAVVDFAHTFVAQDGVWKVYICKD
jgi:hypothetical protein